MPISKSSQVPVQEIGSQSQLAGSLQHVKASPSNPQHLSVLGPQIGQPSSVMPICISAQVPAQESGLQPQLAGSSQHFNASPVNASQVLQPVSASTPSTSQLPQVTGVQSHPSAVGSSQHFNASPVNASQVLQPVSLSTPSTSQLPQVTGVQSHPSAFGSSQHFNASPVKPQQRPDLQAEQFLFKGQQSIVELPSQHSETSCCVNRL